jgi:hypothetical protein
MALRDVGLALAAGLATALVVGVLVTELALPFVAFSLFVGVPVGFVAGLTAIAFVLLGLADELPTRRRRGAVAVGVFGVVFLLVFVVEAVILSTRTSVALPVATIVGVLVAVLAFLRSSG